MRVVLGISSVVLTLAACGSRSGSPLQEASAPPTASAVQPEEPRQEAEPSSEAEPGEPVVAVVEPREPNPYIAPPLRRAGDLTVEAPPREPTDDFGGRMRAHVEGSLSKGSPRVWVGPQVPGFVPLMQDTAELFLLDRVGDEFMAFYRDPYGASSCGLGDSRNCHYFVRIYDVEGNERFGVALHELLSASSQLEVQDVRWADGVLYFNEACQSYSRQAKGKCSSLVAYDPSAGEIRWRTRPLVSNNRFLIHGDHIVTGYGFTAERDYVYVVRRRDGTVVQKLAVPTAPEGFTLTEDGLLEVLLYPNERRLFALQGWDGAKPRLVKTERPEQPGRVTTGRR